MPAINFMPRFADAVANGKKRSTIRKTRKNPIKVGDILYLKTGMRTRACKSLGEVTVNSVSKIEIDEMGSITLDGAPISMHTERIIAKEDGFETYDDFVAFFDKFYGLPFEGVIIRW